MIAQLIGGDTKSDDPNQRQKIQKVFLSEKLLVSFFPANLGH